MCAIEKPVLYDSKLLYFYKIMALLISELGMFGISFHLNVGVISGKGLEADELGYCLISMACTLWNGR